MARSPWAGLVWTKSVKRGLPLEHLDQNNRAVGIARPRVSESIITSHFNCETIERFGADFLDYFIKSQMHSVQ